MKLAGHENPRTFEKSYAYPVCEVDGPATYLGIASRHGPCIYLNIVSSATDAFDCTIPCKLDFKLRDSATSFDTISTISTLAQ